MKDLSIQEDGQDEEVFFTGRKLDDELVEVAKTEELENWQKNNMLDEVKYTVEKFVSVSLVFTGLEKQDWLQEVLRRQTCHR